MAVLGYLAKLKRGLGRFWCTFSAWFFDKNVPYLIPYQWAKLQCHALLLPQDIKQNVLLSSYLDSYDVIRFKIFLGSTSKAMADREKKRGRQKYKNLNISRTKSFLDEIKTIFHSFWRAIIWWIKKLHKK